MEKVIMRMLQQKIAHDTSIRIFKMGIIFLHETKQGYQHSSNCKTNYYANVLATYYLYEIQSSNNFINHQVSSLLQIFHVIMIPKVYYIY